MFTELISWLHDPSALLAILQDNWEYGLALVALIIFVETGIVIMPFLPGDSILFALGAFFGVSGLNPVLAIAVLFTAAFLGDLLNYHIGASRIGQVFVRRGWVKPEHMQKTHDYFEKYGGTTIILARFVPIVRTIAPFVAGMSLMTKAKFMRYNIVGAIVWTGSLVLAGFYLGQIPWVQQNLKYLVLLIVFVSVLPMAVHILQGYLRYRKGK